MNKTLWPREDIALIVAIVTLACVAAFLSVKLTRPVRWTNAGFNVTRTSDLMPPVHIRGAVQIAQR